MFIIIIYRKRFRKYIICLENVFKINLLKKIYSLYNETVSEIIFAKKAEILKFLLQFFWGTQNIAEKRTK